eukprot:899989-Pyramimonas_sp.AAC.1
MNVAIENGGSSRNEERPRRRGGQAKTGDRASRQRRDAHDRAENGQETKARPIVNKRVSAGINSRGKTA